MAFNELLRHFKIRNVDAIMPINVDTNMMCNAVNFVIESYERCGIRVPNHTVFVCPSEYSSAMESPFAMIDGNFIMLFPLGNPSWLIFQYLHELCHMLTGTFPPETGWIAELLSCSCSFLFFQPAMDPNFYNANIYPHYKDFAAIKANFRLIKSQLAANPRLVYMGDYQIQSAFWSYYHVNNSFDTVGLLKQYIAARNNPSAQAPLNNYIISILEG